MLAVRSPTDPVEMVVYMQAKADSVYDDEDAENDRGYLVPVKVNARPLQMSPSLPEIVATPRCGFGLVPCASLLQDFQRRAQDLEDLYDDIFESPAACRPWICASVQSWLYRELDGVAVDIQPFACRLRDSSSIMDPYADENDVQGYARDLHLDMDHAFAAKKTRQLFPENTPAMKDVVFFNVWLNADVTTPVLRDPLVLYLPRTRFDLVPSIWRRSGYQISQHQASICNPNPNIVFYDCQEHNEALVSVQYRQGFLPPLHASGALTRPEVWRQRGYRRAIEVKVCAVLAPEFRRRQNQCRCNLM